jgi:4-phytase / acid phosphatase
MNIYKSMLTGLFLALAIAFPASAQSINGTDDGTTLKQIIIFGRHSIRSSTVAPATLAAFTTDLYPYPAFVGVPQGYLTPHGREAARLLGSYFHDYLAYEGLLTDNATATEALSHCYFRANSIERSNVTASMLGAGLIPKATQPIPVHSYKLADNITGAPAEPDPVFDPVAANVATIDADRAVTEVLGIYGSGAALASAYSGELALTRAVLNPPGPVDPTSQNCHPFTLFANIPILYAGGAINFGGLNLTNTAIDPFIMQYTDNFSIKDVGWGSLGPDNLSQLTRLTVLQIEVAMRTPYLSQVQSSNAASHVLRSMCQAIVGFRLPGAFGNAKSRVMVIISSDYYVAGLAGLLGLHWTLPGYQQDFCAPGGALVFELRQVRQTREYIVRVYYTAQTLSQLRNLTPLSLATPPATVQLEVPGGSNSDTDLDVRFSTFRRLMRNAIERKYVQPFREEVPPGVLDNVTLD